MQRSRTHRRARRAAPRGTTLIELIVVLAIIGLAGGAVALAMPDQGAALHRQADEFGLRLARAREEAILGGRAVRLVADADGYGYSRRDFDRWLPLDDGPFARREWRDGVGPAFGRDEDAASFVFDPTGAADAQALRLALGQRRVEIALEPTGKVRIDGDPR